MPIAIRTPDELIDFVQEELRVRALPEKAPEMAAYMKVPAETFYGVSRPGRREIERALRQQVQIRSAAHYREMVAALWARPHREERYLALNLAQMHRAHITPAALPLYEQMVREGAWWDLVDVIATWLIGGAWQRDRAAVDPVMDRFIADGDLWIRRTAILAQIRHKQETDAARLFRWCLRCAPEKDFFIRKAIGWALREHSKTDPVAVRRFLGTHREALSGLSYREGARHLRKHGGL